MTIYHTYCRQCISLCGLLVSMEEGHVGSVYGDSNHPISHGYTCGKGRAFGVMHSDPRRMNVPRMRVRGELTEVSWEVILDDLAARIDRARAGGGADRVAMYLGSLSGLDTSGRAVAQRFHRALGSKSRYTSVTVDCPAKPFVNQLVLHNGGLVPLADHQSARLVILIGTNPVVSHGHTWSFPDPIVTLRDMRRRGEVWVLDPVRTETARNASRHLPTRPSSDHAILAFLVREVLRDGADHDYISRYTTGVTLLGQAVNRFDLEYTHKVSGVSKEDLQDLLASVRRAGRVAVLTGTGVTMSRSANVVEWLALALPIITGSLDREGGMWFNPGFVAKQDQQRIAWSDDRVATGPPSRPELPRRFGQYPCSALADEIEAGNITALLCLAGNPVSSIADPTRLVRAIKELDMFAVFDIRDSASVDIATHVFACSGPLERPDVPLGVELYQPAVATQYTPALLPRGVGRRSMWWIFAQLASRLGLDVLPSGLDLNSTDDEVLTAFVGPESMAALTESPSGATADRRFGWVTGDRGFRQFDLAPQSLIANLEHLPVPDGLVLLPRRQNRHINSWFPPVHTRQDTPDILLHPDEASSHGIASGDVVRVTSQAGNVVGTALVDASHARGALSIPHGYTTEAAPNVNALLSARTSVDELTGMIHQSGVPVTLVRLPTDSASGSPRDNRAEGGTRVAGRLPGASKD